MKLHSEADETAYQKVAPLSDEGRGLKPLIIKRHLIDAGVAPLSDEGRGLKPSMLCLAIIDMAVAPLSDEGRGLKPVCILCIAYPEA